jgi:hypothetical protein
VDRLGGMDVGAGVAALVDVEEVHGRVWTDAVDSDPKARTGRTGRAK